MQPAGHIRRHRNEQESTHVRVLRRAAAAACLISAACAPHSATPPASPVPPAVDAAVQETAAASRARIETGFTPADVRFMQDMIGHHAQALVMAAMAPTHGAGEQLLRLAEKIDISQRDEIAMMQDWLVERGQPLPDEHYMHTHGAHMPGMLTDAQLAQLGAARGREFERLFLTFMIRHHEGALAMVDALFASAGAAQDPDIFRFATDVAADQLDEIDQMQHLLDMLNANRGSGTE
jgi:uncharacterized protein (DUF305 family)